MKIRSINSIAEKYSKRKTNKNTEVVEAKIEVNEHIEYEKYKSLMESCKEIAEELKRFKILCMSLIEDIEDYDLENDDLLFTGIVTRRTMDKIKELLPKEYEKFVNIEKESNEKKNIKNKKDDVGWRIFL